MATIIKRGMGTPSQSGEPVRGVAFDLDDMSHHGDRYLEKIRDEAAKIVQQANVGADQVRSEAEAAGREAAEQAIDKILAKKMSQQMATLRPAIEQVVSELDQARGQWLSHWEQSAITLAGRIAERIVRRQISQQPEITIEWAREALQLTSGGSEATVRLNPSDHENLGEQVEAVAESLAKAVTTRVVADESISPGGCVVETRHGVIDAQVESQITRMIEELQ